MKMFQGALSLLFIGLIACSGSDKKRDKQRSNSLGSEKTSRRSLSVVEVEYIPCSPKPHAFDRDESSNSLCDMPDTPTRILRPNEGKFDKLKTPFHVLAPVNPDSVKIGDYRGLFPDPETPNESEKKKHAKKKSSAPPPSSSSSSSSDDDKDQPKQRRRGNSLGSLKSSHKKK